MKTTIEISETLLNAAKRQARERGTTLRALVEQGLRRVLQESSTEVRFKLKRKSFGGKGRDEGSDWDGTRDLIYRGRGT